MTRRGFVAVVVCIAALYLLLAWPLSQVIRDRNPDRVWCDGSTLVVERFDPGYSKVPARWVTRRVDDAEECGA